MEELAALGTVAARSHVIDTAPLGPAQRRFANAAILLETELDPEALLAALQHTEREFGRKRARRWGDRVLDLDIALWSEGAYRGASLQIPHREYARRTFVVDPAAAIAPGWRDPITGLSLLQAKARLTRPRPAPR